MAEFLRIAGQRAQKQFLPMTSFTWIYLRAKTSDSSRAAALSDLLNWTYSEGQTLAEQEGYTALPPKLLTEVKRKLHELALGLQRATASNANPKNTAERAR